MSNFWAGYILGLWTMAMVCSAAWWIVKCAGYEEPKPWE